MNTLKSNIVYAVLILCGLFVLSAGCHSDYLGYDTDLKDGIYFGGDSLNFKFGMSKGEDFDYTMQVVVLGLPRDEDREFVIEVVADSTSAVEGLHYEIPTHFIVKAGLVVGDIPLVLHRYKDPEITKRDFVLQLQLKENDCFRLVMQSECKLVFSDTELPQPRWWHDGYFGPYSQLLMMDIFFYYWQLEETHPLLYERIVDEYGKNLEKAFGFPFQQKIAFIKYIITPAYQYYQEHPNERVDIPDPDTLL